MSDEESFGLLAYREKLITGDRNFAESLSRLEREQLNNLNFDIHLADVNSFIEGRQHDLELLMEEIDEGTSRHEDMIQKKLKYAPPSLRETLLAYQPVLEKHKQALGLAMTLAFYLEIATAKRGGELESGYRLGWQRHVALQDQRIIQELSRTIATLCRTTGTPMSAELLGMMDKNGKKKDDGVVKDG